MTVLMHLARATEWQQGKRTGSYAPPSLEQEGFIHCSLPHQLCGAANRYMRGASDLWLLSIDGTQLASEMRWENTVGGEELFPHVYGPIDPSSVFAARPFRPRADGMFAFDDDSVVVGAVNHIYLTVSDLARARRFFDPVMDCLGFRIGVRPIGGDDHVHYFNRVTQVSLRPARSPAPHDPCAPGLHHLCLQVTDREAVDRVATRLQGLGVAATAPAVYAEYSADYYATFFEAPEGMRFEVVARRARRDEIARRFSSLPPVVNPLATRGPE
ncbi:MAG: DUF952 domain-containing protein [Myxococcales bacterium]|nr:DUF952 domain-containing protein [Myxococcales bacterium]